MTAPSRITDHHIIDMAAAIATVCCPNTDTKAVRICLSSQNCDCLRMAVAAAEEDDRIGRASAISGMVEDAIIAEDESSL